MAAEASLVYQRNGDEGKERESPITRGWERKSPENMENNIIFEHVKQRKIK